MPTKTEAPSLKMAPEVRNLWEKRAQAECRTLTNLFEVMVRTCAKKLGVAAAIHPRRFRSAKRKPGGTE
jgi:hypothetical protein